MSTCSLFRSTLLQVPFLNLMSNLEERGGTIHVRVGGNTQETASLVDYIPDYRDISKDYSRTSNPVSLDIYVICI